MREPKSVLRVAPGIDRLIYAKNHTAYRVYFSGRHWTTAEIGEHIGLPADQVAGRIRSALRLNRDVAYVFRAPGARVQQPHKDPDTGPRWVTRPSCRHDIGRLWRLALCAPWNGDRS
jgi:hypothetical protein